MRRGRGELLMMIMIDFQFECLIIHVNESKSSQDNQLWEIINMIIPELSISQISHSTPDHEVSSSNGLNLFSDIFSAGNVTEPQN